MNTLRLLALTILAVSMLTNNLVAADNGKPTKPGEPKPVPAATKPDIGADKSDRLEGMIKEMGVNFEKKADEKTGAVYFLVKEYGPDSYFFEIEESKNKNYTWVSFPCTKAPESGIPAEVMEKMLTENTKMSTAYFQYFPKNRMIMLKMPLASSTLNAKELKQHINWLLKDASRTRPLWDSTAWGKADSAK